MSSKAVQTLDGVTRRHLSTRQRETVDVLIDAAVAELRESGYQELTIRRVAKRAGVAAATAYTYFASKDHLVAEVFWRRLIAQDDDFDSPDPVERVSRVLSWFGLVVADESELAAACTIAVLAADPNVADLRSRIGHELNVRLRRALGERSTTSLLRTLQFAMSGLMLQVGTGHLGYDELPRLIEEITTTIIGNIDMEETPE